MPKLIDAMYSIAVNSDKLPEVPWQTMYFLPEYQEEANTV